MHVIDWLPHAGQFNRQRKSGVSKTARGRRGRSFIEARRLRLLNHRLHCRSAKANKTNDVSHGVQNRWFYIHVTMRSKKYKHDSWSNHGSDRLRGQEGLITPIQLPHSRWPMRERTRTHLTSLASQSRVSSLWQNLMTQTPRVCALSLRGP